VKNSLRLHVLILSFISVLVLLSTTAVHAKMVYLEEATKAAGQTTRRVVLADDRGQMIRYLTPANQDAYHPEISSDGRWAAYSIGKIQPGQTVDVAIHLQDLKTGDIEVWTPSGNQFIHAEFSGNGEYLAYSGPVRLDDGSVQQRIHVVHLPSERAKGPVRVETTNGQVMRHFSSKPEILPETMNSYFPAIASDGSFVVYHRTPDKSSHKTDKELMMYDRRDGSVTRVSGEGLHAMVPSLSFDNRYVAYAGIRNDRWDLHVIDLWTLEDRQITNSAVREFTPVFAPDGSLTYANIATDEKTQETQIDLYRIEANDVFDRSKSSVSARGFIANADVAEYVPAFSGDLSWNLTLAKSLPAPARSSFGAVEHNGKIYVAGGHQGPEHTYPPESFLDQLDIYDMTTGQWTSGARMSVPRHGFEMVAAGPYIYAFGGFAYSADHQPKWKSLDIIERYDIENDRWEVLPVRLPRPRSSNVVALVENRVYLIGGWDSTPKSIGDKEGQFHRSIDVFDLNDMTTSVANVELPDPLRRAFTAVVHGDEIILLGGIGEGASHFNWLDQVTVFSPKTNSWRELPPLPFATFAPGAGVIDGQLMLFGGMTKRFEYVNTIFTYNLLLEGAGLDNGNTWSNSGRYLRENKGFPIVVELSDSRLGVLGGHTYWYENGKVSDSPVDTFEVIGRHPVSR